MLEKEMVLLPWLVFYLVLEVGLGPRAFHLGGTALPRATSQLPIFLSYLVLGVVLIIESNTLPRPSTHVLGEDCPQSQPEHQEGNSKTKLSLSPSPSWWENTALSQANGNCV